MPAMKLIMENWNSFVKSEQLITEQQKNEAERLLTEQIKKLKKVEHNIRIGKRCEYMPPTITESCLLEDDGQIIGFYLNELPEKLKAYISIANKEFMSDNVPKTLLERSDVMQTQRKLGITRSQAKKLCTVQMSTILIEDNTLKVYRFGNLFTSSISNLNISAPFHQDRGNLKDTVNVIMTKRKGTKGGSLSVPDYDEVFEQSDNSILVYPAWRNVHGVTPIKQIHEDGYRNSLIFYPIKKFKGI